MCRFKFLLLMFIGVFVSAVYAQGVGASSVENLNRNLEGPSVLKGGAKDVVVPPSFKPEAAPAGGYSFMVRGFQFEGATAFVLDELMRASGVRLLQSYDLAGLQAIADALTIHYRESGYLVARVWLAPQAIKDGMVVFQVYEGYLSDAEPFRVVSQFDEVDKGRVQEIVRQSLCQSGRCSAKPLTQERVERAALLVGEIMGYQVVSQLVPGQELGATTMVLAVNPRLAELPVLEGGGAEVGAASSLRKKGYTSEFAFDNFGSKATGVNRGQAVLVVSDLLQAGDRLGLSYMTTDKSGIQNYAIDYSVALGDAGWRVGGGAGKTSYTLAGAYGGFSGGANSANVYASYPIIRSVQKNLDFRVDYDHIQLNDESIASESRRLESVRVGLAADFLDRAFLGASASTTWGVAVAQSNLKYDDGRTALVSSTVGTQHKYTARFSRLQGLDDSGWYLGGNVYGQRASGNLDSYGKLFLGGANAVRAYAGGEVGGDTAIIGQFSLGKAWPISIADRGLRLDVSTFYDRGWARLQQDPSVGAVAGNQVTRAGWGLEAKVAEKDKFSLRTFWAKGRSGDSIVDGKRSRVGVNLNVAF